MINYIVTISADRNDIEKLRSRLGNRYSCVSPSPGALSFFVRAHDEEHAEEIARSEAFGLLVEVDNVEAR